MPPYLQLSSGLRSDGGISTALREDRLDRLDATPLIHQQLLQAPGDELQDRLLSLLWHLYGLQLGSMGNALLQVKRNIVARERLHDQAMIKGVLQQPASLCCDLTRQNKIVTAGHLHTAFVGAPISRR